MEKSWVSGEKRSMELVTQQNETEVKLAEVVSLNATLSEEVADLRAALEACESKWYDEGFADAEKGVEPVVMQARQLSFHEGWKAALQALGVPEDSPLRDPGRITFPNSTPATQNPVGPNDKEETDSLRELVEQIDAHVEMIGTEVTSNPLLTALLVKMFISSPLQPSTIPSRWPLRHSLWILLPDLSNLFYSTFICFRLITFDFKLVCPCCRAVATKQLTSGFFTKQSLNFWV